MAKQKLTFFNPVDLIIVLLVLVLGFRHFPTVITDHFSNLKVDLPKMSPQLIEALVSTIALNTDSLMVGTRPNVDHDLLYGFVAKITLSTIENLVSC